ncbi:MAG: HAMP domain-containing histidine kinase [Patescibacteria group bacterium]|nr:HAMP domain-containing histidine kinase [Patescibacteria group bacterium]
MYKTFKRRFSFILHRPKNRVDYVMHIILSGFLVVAILSFINILIDKYSSPQNYDGGPPLLHFAIIILLFVGLRMLHSKYSKIVGHCFLLLLLSCTAYIIIVSGIENPFALLLMFFYIVLSSMIFKGKYYLVAAFILFAAILLLAIGQDKLIFHPNLAWKVESFPLQDTVSLLIILIIIVLISWLFNREINNYILRLEESKKLLKKERDMLEEKVKERTAELRTEQIDRLAELSKLAEFGRLAQGLFHDLVNPLTALSLNLNQAKKEKDTTKIKNYLQETTFAAENMRKLIDSTLNYSKDMIAKDSFSITDELKNIGLVCGYKARQAGVNLVFQDKNDIKLIGNKTRFSQLISNLVLNAVEAYEQQKDKIAGDVSKKIVIKFYSEKNNVVIKITDNAFGIPEKVRKNIFEPFYSTKKHLGNSGIGLSMCKDIVESDFAGKIQVKSQSGEGTEFIITIPQTL